jgi:DNA-binding CsgD family transcriptional regulator
MELARELFRLTNREAQIAGLLFAGRSTGEIAAALAVVPETVRFHFRSIFEKTGARGRAEVVALLAQLVR